MFILVALAAVFTPFYLLNDPEMPVIAVFLIEGFFILILAWLYYELRTKALKLIIRTDHIIAIRVMGLGKIESYLFSETEGFVTMNVHSRYGVYEYLYLVREEKKIAGFSQFYHRNYEEMKQLISEKMPDLGETAFNMKAEIKGIFKR
jgi:hypothetical protein